MDLQPQPKRKDLMLQITGTGVSGDYRNQYIIIGSTFESATRQERSGVQAVTDLIKKEPVKLYEEWFNEEELAAHVDDSNRDTIAELNEIAKELNSLANNNELTIDKLQSAHNQAHVLIGGEGTFSEWRYVEYEGSE